MRKRSGTTRLIVLILTTLAVVCATGCGGSFPSYRGVITFENAKWAFVDGHLYLLSADFLPESKLTEADVTYLFGRGVILTPGFAAELMQAEKEDLP